MVIGSHNSWSYLSPKKWWMKPFIFMAKCQDLSIIEQYNLGVRCFDLRVKFPFTVSHGFMDYKITWNQLMSDLKWLDRNSRGDIYIRVLHEVRNKKDYTTFNIESFRNFCTYIKNEYKDLKFWCGRNLYNWQVDYKFYYDPTCEEKYASVCNPKIIDDWYPRIFAKLNNKEIIKQGTDKDILLIDFVNYGH